MKLHDSDDRMAGFNLYEVASDGAIGTIVAHRLIAGTETFRDVLIPRA